MSLSSFFWLLAPSSGRWAIHRNGNRCGGTIAHALSDPEPPHPDQRPLQRLLPETPTPTPAPTATPTRLRKLRNAIDLDITLPEIAEVKREVLKRIDLMPNVSAQNKDRLYGAVERARGMGRLFSVSFEFADQNLPEEIASMKAQLDPQVKKFLDDPTLVLVILGYADKQGDDQKNLQISNGRAQAVMEALRDQIGVQNVMHVVPMGGTDLLDARELAKNRIVEVWGVLP